MVRGIKIILINFIIMMVVLSCNKLIPTGFWNSYQKDFLVKKISDQGPWGGHRAMYWKSKKQGTFNSKEIIDFAVKNNWELVDSLKVTVDELKTWYYNTTPIFPLSHIGFSNPPVNTSTHEHFPRWINTEIMVYKFKTGLIIIDAATENSIDVNGFVVLNNDGSEMSVYHLWGE